MEIAGSQINNPDGATSSSLSGPNAADWGYRIKLGSTAKKLDLDSVSPSNVAGGVVIAPGLTTTFDISTQNAMAGTGLSTGVKVDVSVSTIFNVYWCSAGDFSGGLGFSTTAPTRINGVYVLGAAAIPVLCRFIGWIRVDASGNLIDTIKDRHIVNYYNRRATAIEVVPNYNNNNAITTYARTLGAYGTMTATAATSQMSFIANGEDAPWIEGCWNFLTDTVQNVTGGIGRTTTTPLCVAGFPPTAASVVASVGTHLTYLPTFGTLETISQLCLTGGAAVTFIADYARTGSASDPPATFLRGWIMA